MNNTDPDVPGLRTTLVATGAEVADGVTGLVDEVARDAVDEAVSTISMLVLFVLMVPIGLLVLIVSFVLLGVIYTTVGTPGGTLGSVVGLAWFGGTLVMLAFVFRALYRRMPRRLRTAYAKPMEPRTELPLYATEPATASVTRSTPALTLAELDARLAPSTTPEPRDLPG